MEFLALLVRSYGNIQRVDNMLGVNAPGRVAMELIGIWLYN